jgi:glycosyltransferase involved in cell wall biosynthesis
VETYVMLLAEGLARASGLAADGTMEVTVVTPTAAYGMNDADLPFRVVRQAGFIALLKLVRGADVIHLAGPVFLPMLIGLALRKPVVVEHHGYQAVCPNGLLFYEPNKSICPGHFMAHRYLKCLGCNAKAGGWVKSVTQFLLTFPRRWACQHVAANIAISNHVRNRINLVNARVIYYGIPDPLRGKEQLAEHYAETRSRPQIFAYVGRLVSEKGLELLVEAGRQLDADHRSFIIKFIGDGPERPCLQALVASSGIASRVLFLGHLQGKALHRALEGVDVVVMPSVWEETAGLSAIEQMMRGRLVIATDIGGLGEMVADTGLKFPLGDVKGLTSTMKRVLDQPALIEELGAKARQRARRLFRDERMAEEHIAIYRELQQDSAQLPIQVGTEP